MRSMFEIVSVDKNPKPTAERSVLNHDRVMFFKGSFHSFIRYINILLMGFGIGSKNEIEI